MFCVFCSGDRDKHVCTIHQNSNLAQIVRSKLNSDSSVSNSGKRTKTPFTCIYDPYTCTVRCRLVILKISQTNNRLPFVEG